MILVVNMQLFFFTFFVLLLAFFGMAVGVIFANKELKGSCGGISNIPGMKSDCSCSSPCEKRKAQIKKEQEGESIKPAIQSDYAKINIDKLRTVNK